MFDINVKYKCNLINMIFCLLKFIEQIILIVLNENNLYLKIDIVLDSKGKFDQILVFVYEVLFKRFCIRGVWL